jgi:hypothetical protein
MRTWSKYGSVKKALNRVAAQSIHVPGLSGLYVSVPTKADSASQSVGSARRKRPRQGIDASGISIFGRNKLASNAEVATTQTFKRYVKKIVP